MTLSSVEGTGVELMCRGGDEVVGRKCERMSCLVILAAEFTSQIEAASLLSYIYTGLRSHATGDQLSSLASRPFSLVAFPPVSFIPRP